MTSFHFEFSYYSFILSSPSEVIVFLILFSHHYPCPNPFPLLFIHLLLLYFITHHHPPPPNSKDVYHSSREAYLQFLQNSPIAPALDSLAHAVFGIQKPVDPMQAMISGLFGGGSKGSGGQGMIAGGEID